MNDVQVRPARPADAAEVRSLVTRALLAAGLPSPEPSLDGDLVDLAYYEHDGRGLWVAEREETVVGCVAVDRGEPGAAVLRRLAGGGLDALLDAAIDFARDEGLGAIETVVPPGLPGAREALERAGFTSPPGASELLLRRPL